MGECNEFEVQLAKVRKRKPSYQLQGKRSLVEVLSQYLSPRPTHPPSLLEARTLLAFAHQRNRAREVAKGKWIPFRECRKSTGQAHRMDGLTGSTAWAWQRVASPPTTALQEKPQLLWGFCLQVPLSFGFSKVSSQTKCFLYHPSFPFPKLESGIDL